ncbi:hypothetical protein CVT25_006263, partial [Psilocybe cyanescens]
KIAKSLVSQEQALAASFYGKFFARNLNLYLLQRRPEDWRNLQSERKRTQEQQEKEQEKQNAASPEVAAPQKQKPAAVVEDMPTQSRKRKSRPENEIDALFNEKLGKRIKKGALASNVAAAAYVPEVPSAVSPNKKKKEKKQVAEKEGEEDEDRELQQVLGAIRFAPANDKKHKKRH